MPVQPEHFKMLLQNERPWLIPCYHLGQERRKMATAMLGTSQHRVFLKSNPPPLVFRGSSCSGGQDKGVFSHLLSVKSQALVSPGLGKEP